MTYSALVRRLFIFADEWLGILLLFHLRDDELFLPVLIVWAVLVYGISYPWHWLATSREDVLRS